MDRRRRRRFRAAERRRRSQQWEGERKKHILQSRNGRMQTDRCLRRRGRYPGRLRMKLLLLASGCLFLLFLFFHMIAGITVPDETGGEYISLQEAGNLIWLLLDCAEKEGIETEKKADDVQKLIDAVTETSEGGETADSKEENPVLTYGQWKQLNSLLQESGYKPPFGKHEKKEPVLRKDWYAFFDAARTVFDPEWKIRDITLTVLGTGAAVTDRNGQALSETELISTEEKYRYCSEVFPENLYRELTAVERDGMLYAIRSLGEEEFTLANVWLMEAEDGAFRCFWNDFEIRIKADAEMQAEREQVSDLVFQNGSLTGWKQKTEKISGRLLRVADGGAEIEGIGFLPFSEQVKLYRLHGGLKNYSVKDLRIGYAFSDYVVEDGTIEAALVTKEENMEYIRVLIKTSGFDGVYHDRVVIKPDCDVRILNGSSGEEEIGFLRAGEVLELERGNSLLSDGRIILEPVVLTGKMALLSVERSQGNPSYRGLMEVKETKDGLLLTNEVLLEEYLYAVVPSEMPAGYPLEALKSQAVCARTYAYNRMLHAGLPSYGAHVDDSTAFQVYNNIMENAETTKAVGETKGKVLQFGENMAETYYYSTSCGYGADGSTWLNTDPESYPYLRAKAVSYDSGEKDAEGLCQEEIFAAYIAGKEESDYEKEEGWYRWSYQSDSMDPERMNEILRRRQEARPGSILTKQSDGSFADTKPTDTGKIAELSIRKRGPGGMAEELLIRGENAEILVKSEYNIRSVLCDGNSKVLRQSGDEVNCPNLLPSAFFVLKPVCQDGYVTGYLLTGGGFGHGVGMSQNGAGNMADAGMSCDEILGFFYGGCEAVNIYE